MDLLKPLLALFKLPLTIITVLRALYSDYATLLARARAPPGLPVPNPTSAFWQDDPPHPELVDMRTAAGPPEAADIVIIGSGITAVAVARTTLHELDRKGELRDDGARRGGSSHSGDDTGAPRRRPRRSSWTRLLVLEARQLCSGATGRNGGHIKASPHEAFDGFVRHRGLEERRAARLCAFQIGHVRALGEVARAEGLEAACEFREVQTVDVAVDAATHERLRAQVDAFAPHWPPGYEMVVHSADEARRRFGASGQVVGAVEYPAGALWPYRFVTGLWRRLLDQFPDSLTVETGTAVETVEVRDGDGDPRYPYVLSTNRGQIIARHVVHATNAFASQLVPGLRGKASGALCHMTAQRPGEDFPEDDSGKRSWSVIFNQGFDYITQRPKVSEKQRGELMVGGGFFQSGKQGMDMFGDYDDSKTDTMTLMHLEGVMPTVFNWGAEAQGRRIIKAWSGIVGFSGDMMPLVGRLDPRLTKRKVAGRNGGIVSKADKVKPGEWIAAYFCGDGMVWAWRCGTAVGIMLAGSEEEDLPLEPGRPAGRLEEWFPPELYANWARVKTLDIADLADEL